MIKSKAQVSVEELGEQYCLIGPYNEACVRTEVELLEPHSYVYKEVIREMRDAGMKVNTKAKVIMLCLIVASAYNLCKQFGPRSKSQAFFFQA